MPEDYFPTDREGDPIKVATDNANLSLKRKRESARKGKRFHPYVIKPIKVKEDPDEKKPVLGRELIPELYPGNVIVGLAVLWKNRDERCATLTLQRLLAHAGSVALLAKTRSGKTTVENHLMEHCVDERVSVFIICSTVDIDSAWVKIVKDLRRRGVGVTTYSGMFHPVTGANVLDGIFAQFEIKKKQEDKEKKSRKSLHEVVQAPKFLAAPNPISDPDMVAPSESKKEDDYDTSAPKRWIFLDDLSSQELRAKCLDNNLKKCRHYKARMCVSTQHIIHLSPSAMTQLSVVCMWKGFSPTYMEKLHDRLGIQSVMDFKQFWLLYSMSTKEEHSFLTYYIKDEKFRAGFALPELPIEAVFVPPDQADVSAL